MAVALRAGPSETRSVESGVAILAHCTKPTTLRTTPRARERGFVNVELGLAEATGADGAAGVGHLLEGGLRGGKVIDEVAKRRVLAGGKLVDERLEHERRVARPCVQVVGVRRARAGNDNAGLSKNIRA